MPPSVGVEVEHLAVGRVVPHRDVRRIPIGRAYVPVTTGSIFVPLQTGLNGGLPALAAVAAASAVMQQSTSSLAARAFILSSFGGELTGEGTALAAAAVTPRGSEEARLAAHAQDLGDRPGLERAAGGDVRRDAVRGLRDRAEPPLAEMRLDPGEHAVDRDAGAPGRVDVRADQPRPDGALVVGGVALGRACRGDAAGSAGRRARASAGRAASAARAGTRRRRTRAASPRQRRSRQRDGEQLVRPHRRVVAAGAVDDVEQAAAVRRGRTARRTTPPPASRPATARARSAEPPRRRARGSTAR